jgi:hypothetical protein
MPVIGYLDAGAPETSARLAAAFRKGLAETGYTESRNVAIEYRWARNEYDRLSEMASDLVRRQVIVIAAMGRNPSRKSPYPPSGALPSLKIAQDLAKAHGWGDYDAEIVDTQAPQVSSSTSPEPMAATILQSSVLRSFRMRAINWRLLDRLFPRKTTGRRAKPATAVRRIVPRVGAGARPSPGMMAGFSRCTRLPRKEKPWLVESLFPSRPLLWAFRALLPMPQQLASSKLRKTSSLSLRRTYRQGFGSN